MPFFIIQTYIYPSEMVDFIHFLIFWIICLLNCFPQESLNRVYFSPISALPADMAVSVVCCSFYVRKLDTSLDTAIILAPLSQQPSCLASNDICSVSLQIIGLRTKFVL